VSTGGGTGPAEVVVEDVLVETVVRECRIMFLRRGGRSAGRTGVLESGVCRLTK
jgi:hypothetical protein